MGCRKLHDEERHDSSQSKNCSGDQIENDLMGRACGTYGEKINSYKVKGKGKVIPLQVRCGPEGG